MRNDAKARSTRWWRFLQQDDESAVTSTPNLQLPMRGFAPCSSCLAVGIWESGVCACVFQQVLRTLKPDRSLPINPADPFDLPMTLHVDALLVRIRGEVDEMPGLRLTAEQASRFLQIERKVCDEALRMLVKRQVLQRTMDGYYVGRS